MNLLNFEEIKFLNSTFDFENILINNLNDLINDFNFIIKTQINFKYNEYYKKISIEINLNSIEKKMMKFLMNFY